MQRDRKWIRVRRGPRGMESGKRWLSGVAFLSGVTIMSRNWIVVMVVGLCGYTKKALGSTL